MPRRDAAHGVPDQHHGVRRLDRALRRDRHLELARGVLGMELKHRQLLCGERPEHVPQVVGEVDEPVHPVRGRTARRIAGGVGDDPLDLDPGSYGEAAPLDGLGHPAGEAALAAGVRRAVLGVPIGGCPGPAGLGGQRGQPGEVRDEPEVPAGAVGERAAGGRVVDQEDVEAGRGADAPLGGVLQLPDGDGLHPGDAGVVDPAEHHPLDAVGGQSGGGRAGLRGAFGAGLHGAHAAMLPSRRTGQAHVHSSGARGTARGRKVTACALPVSRSSPRPWLWLALSKCDAGHSRRGISGDSVSV